MRSATEKWRAWSKPPIRPSTRVGTPWSTPAASGSPRKARRGDLDIGREVSAALVDVVRQVSPTPRYLIAKGGITSSDVATRGLGVQRAWVLGQILPGIPVWRLGAESRFPGLPYVVFPGNVGADDSLADAIRILRGTARD